MPKKTGRPVIEDVPEYLKNQLPQKESEQHRKMRAYYLSLPPEKRSYLEVARQFNVDRSTVKKAAIAFGWLQDAEKRDSSVSDPFYEKHQEEIDQARLDLFRYFCIALQKELKRQAFEVTDSEIIDKIKACDLEGATENWSVKDWNNFVKNNIRASGYKDMLHIIEGIQKVVFEWNPNKHTGSGKPEITIPGDNNKILILDRNI